MRETVDQGESRELGRRGEALAWRFLERKGFKILEKNYRCRLGEVDLIVEDGDRIVFVEVKARRSQEAVLGSELVPASKQRQISRVAQQYFARHGVTDKSGSFAVLIVDPAGDRPVFEWIDDAFPLAWGY